MAETQVHVRTAAATIDAHRRGDHLMHEARFLSGRQAVPHDRIAARAYQRWLARGCPKNDDQRDWFDAETELHYGEPVEP